MTGRPLRLAAFRGLAAFPLRLAVEDGLLERRGFPTELAWTPSSDALMRTLVAGGHDVVQAGPDNVVAWADATGAPIRAWYAGSSGPISLVLAPGVEEPAALRGARIAVDHPDTGWAPILLALLARGGVRRTEIEQVPFGTTARVFAAVAEGRAAAGMLNEPWAARAVAAGCRIAGDHLAVAPRLLTSAGAALEPWLDANADAAAAILAALGEAVATTRDPAAASAIVPRLAEHLGGSEAEAAGLLARQGGPGGWPARPWIRGDALATTVRLRGSALAPPAAEPAAYVRAVRGTGRRPR